MKSFDLSGSVKQGMFKTAVFGGMKGSFKTANRVLLCYLSFKCRKVQYPLNNMLDHVVIRKE